MDPNAALNRIREALEYLADAAARRDDDGFYHAANDLSGGVIALDDWMSTGGFLPDEWEDARPAPSGQRRYPGRRRKRVGS